MFEIVDSRKIEELKNKPEEELTVAEYYMLHPEMHTGLNDEFDITEDDLYKLVEEHDPELAEMILEEDRIFESGLRGKMRRTGGPAPEAASRFEEKLDDQNADRLDELGEKIREKLKN